MKKIVFFLAIALISGLLSIMLMFPDWDLWARLAVGSLFFQTGGVLRQDIFAYSPTRDLWIDHEWGSGVIFFFLTDHFGDIGLFALKFVILFLILLLIVSIIKLHIGKDHNIALFYPIFIGFAIMPGVQNTIRSHMFTFLFFALWLYILERVRKGENRLLWILPVTMIIWANMHGGFVAGLGLLFIYVLGEFLNRKNPLKYLGALILSIAATLINPYGIKYWPYIFEATTMTRPLIPEWQHMTLESPINMFMGIPVHAHQGFMILALLVIIVGLRLFYKKANADWIRILTVLITLYMGVKHQRHAFFFIVIASSLFYSHYAALFEYIKELISNKYNKNIDIWLKSLKNTLSIFFIGITVFLLHNILSISPVRFVVQPDIYPIGSFEFIKQNGLSGNLATTYNWGSYALWKLYPQCRVLIDGRSEEVYPKDIIDITGVFSEKLNPNWANVINQIHADIIVLPKRAYYPMDLLALPDWQIVYEDAISVLLLPKNKIKDLYIKPNFNNPIYLKEDLSKHVNLN